MDRNRFLGIGPKKVAPPEPVEEVAPEPEEKPKRKPKKDEDD